MDESPLRGVDRQGSWTLHAFLCCTHLNRIVCCAGSEACHALSSAVRWLPQDISLSRQSTATEEHLCLPSMPSHGIGKHTQDAAESKTSQSTAGDDREHMERSHTGQLDSIAEQEALHSNGNATSQEHDLENGHSASAQDGEQYETLTFHVGGNLMHRLHACMLHGH